MDGDSRKKQSAKPSNMVHDDCTILQSLWIRHSSVLAANSNWKFVESEFRFVLYSGIVLWTIHFISLAL
jgi:hypothetical protein